MEFNIYCDETCHLEYDGINVMGLGAVWCPANKIKEINADIYDIKAKHGISAHREVKWTTISPAKTDLYRNLVDYFFANPDIHFRAVVIPDKSKLNHRGFHQTHDDWYYKMYYDMLKVVFNEEHSYSVYIDIKDTNSFKKSQKLHEICCNSMHDFSHSIVKKIQPIRSDEVQVMQLVDILVGATARANRTFPESFLQSAAKLEIVDMIKKSTGYSLTETSYLTETKFNILKWNARDVL